jgi:hypothetical protein
MELSDLNELLLKKLEYFKWHNRKKRRKKKKNIQRGEKNVRKANLCLRFLFKTSVLQV